MDTLLVTGIHREELGFGDRVAEHLDRGRLGILRIPQGISHSHDREEGLFYFKTSHKEIYLQLRQQVKGRYRWLIDLHCGVTEQGPCADLYCRDESLLQRIAGCLRARGMQEEVRLVKILADSESGDTSALGARTWIPRQIWDDDRFTYVGLEVYLAHEGEGTPEDWGFARELIETIQDCLE